MSDIFSYILLEDIPKASIIHFFTVFAALSTIIVIYKYRIAPEVKYLIFIVSGAAVWAFAYGMEFMSTELESKIFWSKFSYCGISFIPVFYFFFTKAFSRRAENIRLCEIVLLSIFPASTLLLAITNDFHQLLWTEIFFHPEKNIVIYKYGIWFWLFWTYSLVLITLGVYNLLRSVNDFTGSYKIQVVILLLATLFPLVGNTMYVTGLTPVQGFDFTPVLFVFSTIIISAGVLNFGMFELVPLARNKLIDTMKNGVVVINSNGIIEDHNPALLNILNLSKENVIKKPFKEVFAGYESLIKATEEMEAEPQNIEISFEKIKKHYQVHIFPLWHNKRALSGQLIQIYDITSLKQGEKKIMETNKQLLEEIEQRGKLIDDLNAFAHTIAHDLRNSLGSIYSSSEVIKESLSDQTDASFLIEMSDLVKSAAEKAMHITEELLLLATVRNEKIDKKLLVMDSIFREAKSQLSSMIKEYQAKIISPDIWPQSIGHAPWVEEVWANYLSNAIKYGGTPPLIEVGADLPEGGFVKYWIKDNGNGIAKEEQTKLFKKYSRLAPEKAHGYGLGLSIVKRIVDKLEGRVGLESTGRKGEGAKFWFELPVK